MCVFCLVDLQSGLYELCWHVIQGNLKVDVAAGLLADVMVSAGPIATFNLFLTYNETVKALKYFN